MVDYELKAPGVYVEDVSAAGPIAGAAGASVAALVGTVTKPPADAQLGVPVMVTSWTSYKDQFGEHKSGLDMPHAVKGFFDNGGTTAYVVPVKDLPNGLAGALDGLTRVRDVGLVCVPGLVDGDQQKKVTDHCAEMRNRFAVLDGVNDTTPFKTDGELQKQIGKLKATSSYAALYWPWVEVDDPTPPANGPPTRLVPPSGHVAGIMARSDGRVGVHKAPANEAVRGIRDIGYRLNDTEQGQLNKAGVNALRQFATGPPLLWGARTLSGDTAWRYVNVRRLVSYVESSILEGVRWAVFAPNDVALWKGLERSISEFLTRVWRSGALFGRTAAEAFYVRIDDELNPEPVRALGQVFVEVGLAPVRPAEHVVVRLGLWDGGAEVTES
jgi:phage tail sheath protein FI